MGWPLVVTAYTRGTQYSTMVTRLTSSCLLNGLSVHAVAYEPGPSWRRNVNIKRQIIREVLEWEGQVLWLDADSILWSRPLPVLESIEKGVSFAAYNQMGIVSPSLRIHGGSLYFSGGGGLAMLQDMERFAERYPDQSEQTCLDQLVNAYRDSPPPGWGGLHWWPQGMCKIREHDWVKGEDTTEYVRQYQGSRTGRTDVAGNTPTEQGPALPV